MVKRVVIAEDEFFTREGISRLISADPQFEVIGTANQGEEAISLVKSLNPDALLLDIRMPPGIDGIEVIRRLRADGQQLAILALTNESRSIKAAEAAGANGYVPKEKHQMLIPALMCVTHTPGKIFINPDHSQAYLDLVAQVEAANLTESEREVWQYLAYRNEEIARRVHKAPGRIRNIVTELYFKLDIPKTGEFSQRFIATEMARSLGILKEPERDYCNEDS
ncbi:MAG: response regulator transcription factor [Acidobacteria bacterium]|nr:response regulator transcription factor [Acidobacteriota bacterium]MCB9396941.1 response regulator transcription factor [Acidobacteriota bacterium]